MDTVLRDRLVFKRQQRKDSSNKTVQIRVKSETYNTIKEISEESGKSVQDVAEILVKFALIHIEWE